MSDLLKKPTAWVVIAFVIFLVFAEFTWGTEPTNEITIGLSGGVLASQQIMTQRIQYTRNSKWVVSYERFGGRGDTIDADSYSFMRKVDTTKTKYFGKPWVGLGAQYFSDQPVTAQGELLVSEDLMFLLALGTTWQLSDTGSVSAGWYHNSTAGRSKQNKGIDRIALDMTWRF